MSKRRKWPWILAGTLLVLIIGFRLSLKTNWMHQLAKTQIESVANEQLNATLHIEDLKGDLWKEIILTNITLEKNDETVASVDTIVAGYNVWSYFSTAFEVSQVYISRPSMNVEQQDSVWNVTTWLKQSESSAPSNGEAFPVSIKKLNISRGEIDASIESLPGDSAFTISDLSLNGSIDYLGDRFDAAISAFSFKVVSSNLNDPVTVQSKAKISSQSVSLQKLVVATGNSVLETSGVLSLEDSLSQVKIEARPLSWKDIAAFIDEAPVRQDISAKLNIRGNKEQFTLGLNVNANGLQQLQLDADFSYNNSLTLQGISANAELVDMPVFTGDSTLPVLRGLSFDADGNIPFEDLGNGQFNGDFQLEGIAYNDYMLNNMEGVLSLSRGELTSKLSTSNGRQRLNVTAQSKNIFEDGPTSSFSMSGRNINPGYWMKDGNYSGLINFSADISGTGFYPEDIPWKYDIEVKDSQFMEQGFSLIQLEGQFSRQGITNNSTIRLDKSEIDIEAEARQITSNPVFNYTIIADNFDLSECRGLENFASSISGRIKGEGSGNSLENLKLNSSLQIDSSVVNGESINQFMAQVEIQDTVATIRDAFLQSAIADGSFDARLHLTDYYRTSNKLNLDVQVKDLRALAPLVGSDKLQADGKITGELSPIQNNSLKFTGNINLSNVNYDDSFTAANAEGNIEASITEEPQYVVDVNLTSPSFAAVNLQDFNIQTRGQVRAQQITGAFNLSFSSAQDGEINQEGSYIITEDSSVVKTDMLDLASSTATLALQRPFEFLIKNEAIKMDTLSLQSADGASFKLAVPYADSLKQEVFLSGQNLNLAVLQNALLGESYIEGMMLGSLHINRVDTTLTAEGDLTISDIVYRETMLDEFKLKTSIRNGLLSSDLAITDSNKEIILGKIEVPFTLQKPATINDSFFDQPINGFLRINRVALNDFENLLESAGITETDGILSFDGQLEGRAGMPKLTGDLNLDQAVLSGVQVDSVTADLNYDHEQSVINLNAAVNSLNQKAADVTAKIPFYVDLLTFEASMAKETDPINVVLETNNFKLAALNDFVDPKQVRNIQGRLDGVVEVTGLAGDLKTDGKLSLSNGAVQIVPAGIRISEMKSNVIFEPNQIRITDFSAKSGRGTLSASGAMDLKRLVPDEMDISISARNFRAANTAQYNAAINADVDINGTFTSPDISGRVRFQNGFVELDNFGEKSVENVSLDSTETVGETSAVYDSLSINMDVSFDRRFFVRNERYLEMELELEGQVNVVKETVKDLQMFGAINTSSGYARPLGKQFEIEEGQITFSGNPENPSLNVRSLYEPPQPEEEIKIWYIIEGTVESPRFKYESQPEMELQSIISYTLFGQPFYKLDSWQQVVANSGSNTTAADVAMEVLLDRVESLATRQLGIDVVKIDNTLAGGESGTSITTGWYISPKIFFAIQNVITGSTPDTGFILEYKLRQNLKLILRQGNDSRQGVDLRWNHDY
ncbi:MAG: translocation/assembly module TamB domain-containing protein [Balneolaceae bacterium]|nr:translocation/assembly module TamB domain-containing protein [Balneolaceae bacterium]